MVAAVSKSFSEVQISPRETHMRINALYVRFRASLLRDARQILPRGCDEAEDAVQDALVAVVAAGIASEEALRAATRRAALIRARNGRARETAKYEIARGAMALDLFEHEANDGAFDDVDDE